MDPKELHNSYTSIIPAETCVKLLDMLMRTWCSSNSFGTGVSLLLVAEKSKHCASQFLT